jgi:hypothetical protein
MVQRVHKTSAAIATGQNCLYPGCIVFGLSMGGDATIGGEPPQP